MQKNSRLDKIEEQLKALEEKKLQMLKAKKKIESKQALQASKQDTRRKILLGACLMELMKKDPALQTRVNSSLEAFLVRKIDREAFGLPVIDEPRKRTTDEKAQAVA